MNSKREIFEKSLCDIKDKLSVNTPLAEIARDLDFKYDTLKKYLNEYHIEYKTNQSRKGFSHDESRISIDKYFSGEKSIVASKLRRRLIEEGYKDEVCECCGLSEWMGKKIPLELHHKDGNHYNNSLDNLQILCSNCHMQAHNYSNFSLKK